jgi:hypothetical protein
LWSKTFAKTTIRIANGFKVLSAETVHRPIKNFPYGNTMSLFFARFRESIWPLIERDSLLHYLLASNYLILENTEPSPDVEKKSVEASRISFNTIKQIIQKDGGNSCPFDPHIIMLVDVVSERWKKLRELDDIELLLSEALWVQDTFAKTIDIDSRKPYEEGDRISLFCFAAANIGHVYLVKNETNLYEEQLYYVKKGLKLLANQGSGLFLPLQSILNGKRLN